MKFKYFFILMFIISFQFIFAQFEGYTPELPIQTTTEYSEANVYQQDFLYLCEGLINFHANVYLNFPKEEFDKEKLIIFNKLKNCNDENEFTTLAALFVNKIKDGHAGLKGENQTGNVYFYPFKTKYLIDSLYITSVTDQLPSEFNGTVIKSINNVSLQEIEKRTCEKISFENYVSKQKGLMMRINNTWFLKFIDVIKNDSDKVIIETTNGKQFIALPNSNNNYTAKLPPHLITEVNNNPFSYKIIKDKNLCYIQFNRFVDKRIGEMYINMLPWYKRWLAKTYSFFGGNIGIPDDYFEDFVNECVTNMKANNITKVLIDLRNNSGGSSYLGDLLFYAFGVDKYKSFSADIKYSELLKMQMEAAGREYKPTTNNDTITDNFAYTKNAEGVEKITQRINADVYVAVGEWTFSSAVMFATTAADNKIFKVIGEPISERPSHFGEVLFMKLPNTKRVCTLSCKQFHRPDTTKDNDETLYPDVKIYKTYQSITTGVDPVYDYVAGE
ncbi:MAG: S41 family peptidase [bacterium]